MPKPLLRWTLEDKTTLLVPKMDVSSFESLIPRPLEPVGVLSLYLFPDVAQHVMSTMMSNIYGCHRCLKHGQAPQWSLPVPGLLNLDLIGVYDHFLNLLCLREEGFGCGGRLGEIVTQRRCLFEALVVVRLDLLQDISRHVVGKFSNVSRSIDGTKSPTKRSSSPWTS